MTFEEKYKRAPFKKGQTIVVKGPIRGGVQLKIGEKYIVDLDELDQNCRPSEQYVYIRPIHPGQYDCFYSDQFCAAECNIPTTTVIL